jgi:hypothetical protein
MENEHPPWVESSADVLWFGREGVMLEFSAFTLMKTRFEEVK